MDSSFYRFCFPSHNKQSTFSTPSITPTPPVDSRPSKRSFNEVESGSDSEDDVPLATRLEKLKGKRPCVVKKREGSEDRARLLYHHSDDEDDEYISGTVEVSGSIGNGDFVTTGSDELVKDSVMGGSCSDSGTKKNEQTSNSTNNIKTLSQEAIEQLENTDDEMSKTRNGNVEGGMVRPKLKGSEDSQRPPGPITALRTLRRILERSKGLPLSQETIDEIEEYLAIILARLRGEKMHVVMNYIPMPDTYKQMVALIDGPAENDRPWLSQLGAKYRDKSIWRVWSPTSQGKITDPEKGLVSKGAAHLNSYSERRYHLQSHANFRSFRGPTTFLSFGKDLVDLWANSVPRYVERSQKNHRDHTTWITQLNVNARSDRRWPILNALTELNAYGVDWQPLGAKHIFKSEALLPYKVHAGDIVWTWREADIKKWIKTTSSTIADWEKTVGCPALRVHEDARKIGMGYIERRQAVKEFLHRAWPGLWNKTVDKESS